MAPLDDDIYCISLVLSEDVDTLILEDLRDHIIKHFGKYVSQGQIDKALQHPAMALRLVYGIYKGEIVDVDGPGAIEAVKDLKPVSPEKEEKAAGKSDAEKAHDTAKARAREISPTHWLWIMAVWKQDPQQHIDQSIFDYLRTENVPVEDILDKTYSEVNRLSERWHNEQLAQQEEGGKYTLGPDSPEAVKIANYWFVPVTEQDQQTEGTKMQNCIGRGCRVSESNKIWSMRNKFNNPHVSVQVRKAHDSSKWYIDQIKGKQNRAPIMRYELPVLAFIEHQIAINEDLSINSSSDFWRLSFVLEQVSKWLSRTENPVTVLQNRPEFVERLDQQATDDLMVQHTDQIELYPNLLDVLMPKVSSGVVQELFKRKGKAGQKFFMSVLKHKKLSEEDALELLNSSDLRRSARLIILAVYEPDRYMNELMKADVEDIALAIANYLPSIEAYNGRDEFFAEILASLPVNVTQSYAISSAITALVPKIPSEILLQIDVGNQSEHVAATICNAVISRDDIDNLSKMKVCKSLKNIGDLDSQEFALWLQSLNTEELRQLYGWEFARSNKLVGQLLKLFDERDAEWAHKSDDETHAYYLAAEKAETVVELQALMREEVPRTSRELQRHILRKIARLKRLKAMAA